MRNLLVILFFFSGMMNCGHTRYKKIPNSDYVTEILELQGKERSFYVHTPNNQSSFSQKLPLLFVLHGRLGSGKQIMEQAGFNDLSNEESFIIVYPDGYSRSWADGRGKSPSDKEGIDDVKFLETVLERVTSKYSIDRQRIFIAGHSNGGFMTQRMLMERSHLFRGGVSVSAQLSLFVLKSLEPKSPVSVAIFGGTEDPVVPYYGGYVLDGGEILSVDDTIDRWKKWNVCSPERTETSKDEVQDETSLDTVTYSNCKNNTIVRLYRINGGGHAWPGQEQKIPFFNMGRPTLEVNATREIWNFFKSLKN